MRDRWRRALAGVHRCKEHACWWQADVAITAYLAPLPAPAAAPPPPEALALDPPALRFPQMSHEVACDGSELATSWSQEQLR